MILDDELSYLYAPTMPIADYVQSPVISKTSDDSNILIGKIVKLFPSITRRPRKGVRNLIVGANSKEILDVPTRIAPWLQAKVDRDHLPPVYGYGLIAPWLRFRAEKRRVLEKVTARPRGEYMVDMNSCYHDPLCWSG